MLSVISLLFITISCSDRNRSATQRDLNDVNEPLEEVTDKTSVEILEGAVQVEEQLDTIQQNVDGNTNEVRSPIIEETDSIRRRFN